MADLDIGVNQQLPTTVKCKWHDNGDGTWSPQYYVGTVTTTATIGSALPTGTNTIGATKDAGPNWTTTVTYTASADAQSPTAVTAAPTTGQYVVVYDIIVSVDTAMSIEFELEDATSTNYFKVYMAANSTIQITPRGKLKLGTANKKLMIDASAAGNVAVTVFWSSEA